MSNFGPAKPLKTLSNVQFEIEMLFNSKLGLIYENDIWSDAKKIAYGTIRLPNKMKTSFIYFSLIWNQHEGFCQPIHTGDFFVVFTMISS